MFKTRLTQNKDNLIALFCSLIFIVLFIINLLTIVPMVYDIFIKKTAKIKGSPINTQIVNQAIEYLNQ